MYKQGVPGFKYFVGIDSLAQVATREDRVCVLNILGGESSDVTPVGHAFSGGNVQNTKDHYEIATALFSRPGNQCLRGAAFSLWRRRR